VPQFRTLVPVNPPECDPGAEARVQFIWDEDADCELDRVEPLDPAIFEIVKCERGDGRDHSKLSLSARPTMDDDDSGTLVGGIGVPDSALLIVTLRNRTALPQRADARAIVHVAPSP
jgi:hypothetical protein